MTEQGYDAEAPVLIIGGGIVGLSAALFLARHGVDAMLVERRASTSEHPRARGVNARTMELFREAGVADEVRAAGAALAPAVGIHSGATVAGIIDPMPRRDPDAAVTARGSDARQAFAGIDLSELGPAVGARGTQDLIEPVLRRAATAAGADLRFGLAARTVEQDGTGADVTLADGSRIRARYVIAADGAGSPIRKVLGIGREQLHPGGHHLNILFEADLRAFVRDREFSICLIDQPGLHGIVTSIDNDRRWVMHANYDPSVESPADFPPQRCAELAQRAIGLPGLDVRVVSVLSWESAARVADRFRADRVFLAGDAAHQMPPWGGLGANTGIADVHNLAWKLAAVLQRRSAPALLASYQPERRPVGVAAARRSASLSDEDGRLRVTAEPGRLLQPAALHGGVQQYTEGALVPEPSGPVEIDLDGRPGTRLPHLWLDAAHRRSTLDLVGRRPVLLTGPSPDRWAAAATRCGIDLHAVVADGSGVGWCARAGIDADGAVLVRPDGIVGWRAPRCPSDPDAALQHALTVVDATVADPSRDPSRAVGVV